MFEAHVKRDILSDRDGEERARHPAHYPHRRTTQERTASRGRMSLDPLPSMRYKPAQLVFASRIPAPRSEASVTGPHGAWVPRNPLADRRRAWLRTAFPSFRPQLPADSNPSAVRVSLPQWESTNASRCMAWCAPIYFTCRAWHRPPFRPPLLGMLGPSLLSRRRDACSSPAGALAPS